VKHDFDVVVVGVGGMGSAAVHALARRGARVLGLERFDIAHDRGSSHGDTRIIRKAYFEHPDYVPLLHRAYELWGELEEAASVSLFDRCGFLTVGAPGSASIGGLQACYAQHAMPHERLDGGELAARFPQLRAEPDAVAFFDPLGGYLRVEDCVTTQVAQARAAGAAVRTGAAVTSWEAADDGVVVHTDAEEITAAGLVLTTGAWLRAELARVGVAVEVWRKVLFWYETAELEPFLPAALPTFYIEKDYGHFYGFPSVDDRGLKAAEHLAVTPIDDPDALERALQPGDEAPVGRFVAETFPGVLSGPVSHAVCMYTMTPDGHFVIDRHPLHPRVVLAGGFSGHGFKFAAAVGEIAAELALDGAARLPIGFLGLARFA
jgi:sarcosine oxidase